jgi:hypothetical protein
MTPEPLLGTATPPPVVGLEQDDDPLAEDDLPDNGERSRARGAE